MKKITFLLSFLIVTAMVFAQSNGPVMLAKKYQDPTVVVVPQPGPDAPPTTKGAVLSEGFEGATFPPDGWATIDGDNDGNEWDVYTYGPHTGLQCAASASWISSGALTPTNFLVTPALKPLTGDSIVFWVAPQDPAYPADKYSVVLSTTGNGAADFTVTLFTETLTAADSNWVRRAFSLDTYNGQTVYIAFKHFDCTDEFMMKIDDVEGPATSGIGVDNATAIDNSVAVYPNPANALLNIKSDSRIVNVRVFNIIGQTVMVEKPNVSHAVLEINDLDDGLYYVEVETETGIKVKKIAVTR